jgi:nucleolin
MSLLTHARFGYIDFDTTEAATAAVNAMHNQLFEGRQLVCQYARFSQDEARKRTSSEHTIKNAPSKTLFIGNLSFEMNDRDMNELFKGIRNVVDVRVAIDRRTGQARGFAHADFVDVQSAQAAAAILRDRETYGRKLRVDYSFGPNTAPKNQQMPPQQL